MPANRFDNGLKFTLPKNVVIETNAVYTMRQTRTNANVDYAAAPNAYTLFSCNISKTFNIKKTKMATVVGCNNILNKVYRDYMNSLRYYADDLGRNIHIKLKLTF
jgi:iron complex outermembrane receptor protein